MKRAAERERDLFLIINNRAGGNAPLLAQEISQKFLEGRSG
jgi:hypothetical protein